MQRLQTKPVMRTAGAGGEWAFGRRRADAGYPVWSNILMRSIAEFTKTTLIDGILIVLPIYVSLLLLAEAVQGLLAAVRPITAGIPGFRGVSRNPGDPGACRGVFHRADRAGLAGEECR
jgi:hypothetical protein